MGGGVISKRYGFSNILYLMLDLCWRCQASTGTLLHIWRACPPIYKVWECVICLYNLANDESILNSPECLFYLNSYLELKKSLLGFFISAVRQVIPRYWKSFIIPSIPEWI